jgi:microcystin-dependent protein
MSKKFLSPIKLAQGASVPATGSAGELFYNTGDSKIYTHNGTSWLAAGGGVTNSATAPENPTNGDAWFNTTEGTLFIYYADGDSAQWVEASSNINNAEPNQIPAGAIMAWSSSVIPNNWLLCDGSAVSRETYASLFAAIGTTYGTGNGTTTFNLPNLAGRTIVGRDATQTEFDILGETGGAKTHTLTTSEMPAHSHELRSASHTGGAIEDRAVAFNRGYPANGLGTPAWVVNVDAERLIPFGQGYVTSSGGGTAHNNLQPYIVLNYIIKVSAGETPGDSQLSTRVGAIETSDATTNRSGLVPVLPASVSVSAGTASVASDGTVTFTNVGNLSLNGLFSATYTNYLVYLTITNRSVSTYSNFRLRSNGVDNTAQTYARTTIYANASGTTASYAVNNDTFWYHAVSGGLGVQLVMDVSMPFLSGPTYSSAMVNEVLTGGNAAVAISNGWHNTSASFDGITVGQASGTATGTLKIYGYR